MRRRPVGVAWWTARAGRWLSVTAPVLLAILTLAAQEAPVPPPDSTLAQVPAADVTDANRLLGALMSPFCPGLTLATCPSIYAETLRVSIRARLAAGEPADSIVESLVAAFGEGVRGAPPARGLGLALWTVPLVALVLGGIGVAWWLRRRGAGASTPPAVGGSAVPDATDAERAQLKAALREFE